MTLATIMYCAIQQDTTQPALKYRSTEKLTRTGTRGRPKLLGDSKAIGISGVISSLEDSRSVLPLVAMACSAGMKETRS